MDTGFLTILVVIIMTLGLVLTFWVGFSKENKQENPAYGQRTGRKWFRLIIIYIVTLIFVFAVFFAFLGK